MKKAFLLFAVLIVSIGTVWSQTNVATSTISSSSKSVSFSGITPLDELNHSDIAEAYPWISDDGLTLYYVSGDFSAGQMKVVHRNSLTEKFGEPKTLFPSFDDQLGCWLNQNQTNIFFVQRGHLYQASRTSVNEGFSTPKEVNLDFKGHDNEFFSGPSLTENMDELYLYYSGDVTKIIQFKKTANNNYELVGTLPFPTGMDVRPGQLAQNGTMFFTSVANNDETSYSFCTVTRAKIGDKWNRMTKVGGMNSNMRTFNQSALNSKADILVCVEAASNSWANNDLYIAYGSDVAPITNNPDKVLVNTIEEPKNDVINLSIPVPVADKVSPTIADVITTTDLKIYPNPTVSIASIQFSLANDADINIIVTDLSGKEILNLAQGILTAGMQQVSIDMNTFTAGVYFVSVKCGTNLIGSGQVVKQ